MFFFFFFLCVCKFIYFTHTRLARHTMPSCSWSFQFVLAGSRHMLQTVQTVQRGYQNGRSCHVKIFHDVERARGSHGKQNHFRQIVYGSICARRSKIWFPTNRVSNFLPVKTHAWFVKKKNRCGTLFLCPEFSVLSGCFPPVSSLRLIQIFALTV